MCCVEYQLCTSYNSIALADSGAASAAGGSNGVYNEAWSLDMDTSPYVIASGTAISGINNGLTDNYCTGDYVEIPCKILVFLTGNLFDYTIKNVSQSYI